MPCYRLLLLCEQVKDYVTSLVVEQPLAHEEEAQVVVVVVLVASSVEEEAVVQAVAVQVAQAEDYFVAQVKQSL